MPDGVATMRWDPYVMARGDEFDGFWTGHLASRERRLLLIFDPRLSQPRLRELATLLADEGVIHPDQIDSEVDATKDRLRTFYGVIV